jgi:hypothetical protein
MREDEAQRAFDEWAKIARATERRELPIGLCGSIESTIPTGARWAVADARTLYALGPDAVLHSLTLDADGGVSCASTPLAQRSIAVSHSTDPLEFQHETETRQRHHWRFSVDGAPLVALTGTVYGERGRPRDRPDRLQLLAFDLQEAAERSRR